MTAAPGRVPPRSATRPGDVAYRPATTADLPDCERLWRDGLNGYLRPLGIPDVPLENPGLRRLHAHTLATDPDRFWVVERGGRLEAFGSAVLRERVWFLSMLFVDPEAQLRGLGRGILERILPAPGSAALATSTDAAQPISNGLYASLGIVPRVPLFNLLGRPLAGWQPPLLPAGIRAIRWPADGSLDGARDALDRELVGFAHREDHAFVHGDGRGTFAYVDERGGLAGYGYASEAGRVGPLGARDPALAGAVLGHLLTAVEPRGASSVWLPGTGDAAMLTALESGLRIEGFPTLLCWSEPFADLARYVPISPGLL